MKKILTALVFTVASIGAIAGELDGNYVCDINSSEPMFVTLSNNGNNMSQRYLSSNQVFQLNFVQFIGGNYNETHNLYKSKNSGYEGIVTFYRGRYFTMREKLKSGQLVTSFCQPL